MDTIIAWVVAFLVTNAPPGAPQYIPEAKESADETVARYDSIAHDLVEVVYDENEPPLFKGEHGRAKTIAILESIAWHESGKALRKDVDTGEGRRARGDSGGSVCLMQINVGKGRTPRYNTVKKRFAYRGDPESELIEGYTADELLSDRKKCFLTGLRLARESFTACGNVPLDQSLKLYASGKCDAGTDESKHRMDKGMKWYNAHRPSFVDNDVMVLLYPPPPPEVQTSFFTSAAIKSSGTN
jgi:hypothetical protein